MSVQDNMATQERLGNAVNSGQLDALDDIFAANVVDHDPAPDQGPGPDGFKHFFSTLRSAFPDLKLTAEHVDTTENDVAFAYTMTGTHKGEFMGIPATGKRISARGLQIARFENGKIVERWGSSDELGILKQLGAAPERTTMQPS